jgi:protease I
MRLASTSRERIAAQHGEGGHVARIATPLAEGFEDSELTVPRDRLVAAGHRLVMIGVEAGKTLEGKRREARIRVDAASSSVAPEDFEALLIPGGYSPDHLRTDAPTVELVRGFAATGRPIAAICHGPQLLIEADLVEDRTLTSSPSIRKDLENAGARWLDQEVVVDGNLVTSRGPADLEAFCDALLGQLEARAGLASTRAPDAHQDHEAQVPPPGTARKGAGIL